MPLAPGPSSPLGRVPRQIIENHDGTLDSNIQRFSFDPDRPWAAQLGWCRSSAAGPGTTAEWCPVRTVNPSERTQPACRKIGSLKDPLRLVPCPRVSHRRDKPPCHDHPEIGRDDLRIPRRLDHHATTLPAEASGCGWRRIASGFAGWSAVRSCLCGPRMPVRHAPHLQTPPNQCVRLRGAARRSIRNPGRIAQKVM